jgi:hypothetical protein
MALGALGATIWVDQAFAERRVALIIGNSAYQNTPILPNPERDARAIADMFQKAGYDVTVAFNVGNLDFKRTIQKFEDTVTDADIAVIYYAGYGLNIHGTNYLIPIDAKLASDRDANDETITLERLIESVYGAKRLRLTIIDAARTMKAERIASFSGLGAVQPNSIDTLIAYAAKAGTTAQEGGGDHSPFAAALIDNLFVPGLDIRLAFGRVRDEVLKKTGYMQEPFVYGSLGGGNIIALVPAPSQPVVVATDLAGESDYVLVEKIGTEAAWQVFLNQHPTGFYADLARRQIAIVQGKLDAPTTPILGNLAAAAQAARQAAQQAETARQAVLKAEVAGPAAPGLAQVPQDAQAARQAQQAEAARQAQLAQAARQVAQQAEAAQQAAQRVEAARQEALKAKVAGPAVPSVGLDQLPQEAQAARLAQAQAALRQAQEAQAARQVAQQAEAFRRAQASQEAEADRQTAHIDTSGLESASDARANTQATPKAAPTGGLVKHAAEEAAKDAAKAGAEGAKATANGVKIENKDGSVEVISVEANGVKVDAQAAPKSAPTAVLPQFPWPPPAASGFYSLPDNLLQDRRTVGEAVTTIISALEFNGYVERSFFQTETGGVALVTRLERINDDGSSVDGPQRWSAVAGYGGSTADLIKFLRGLFFVAPGHYRVIVFILQDLPFSQSSRTTNQREATAWLMSGVNILPSSIAERPFAPGGHCTVLVYEFASDGRTVDVITSGLTGKQHLEKAGVLSRLGNVN